MLLTIKLTGLGLLMGALLLSCAINSGAPLYWMAPDWEGNTSTQRGCTTLIQDESRANSLERARLIALSNFLIYNPDIEVSGYSQVYNIHSYLTSHYESTRTTLLPAQPAVIAEHRTNNLHCVLVSTT